MAAKYGITDFAYTYRPLMGGEERRELIHEGLVNFQLDKGVSEQEAQQYADANIDQYAKRLPRGVFGLGKRSVQERLSTGL